MVKNAIMWQSGARLVLKKNEKEVYSVVSLYCILDEFFSY